MSLHAIGITIWRYWIEGGVLLAPIALVALGIWGYLLTLRRVLRDDVRGARRAADALEAMLNARAAKAETLQVLGNHPDRVSRDVAEVLRTTGSHVAARRHFEALSGRGLGRVERDLFVLKALTAAAPLLGLLGTVTGMVATFAAVAGQGTSDPGWIARGIRSALITTQYGLVAALPGVFGLLHLGRLRSQYVRLQGAIGMMLYVAFKQDRFPANYV